MKRIFKNGYVRLLVILGGSVVSSYLAIAPGGAPAGMKR